MASILVVDDDQDHRLALVTILDGAGHEALQAEGGKQALDALGARAVDVVVTDLQMPEVHGLELITLLRDVSQPPAIIAISGTGADQLSMAEALGAEATLSKPVLPDQLLSAIDEALAGEDVPTLVVSDPPHRSVDLDAASAIIGLDVFQTRLKFIFPAPEVLAASDRRRAKESARTFEDAGVRLAVMDGPELAEIPWPDPVSCFAFTDSGLTATLNDRALTLPYDTKGVAVYCSPPADFRASRPAKKASAVGGEGLAAPDRDGFAVAEQIEWMANLDVYFVRDDVLHRISMVEDLTDFSGLGALQKGTAVENLEATIAECRRRFPRMHFDTRLENVRPRRRHDVGDPDQSSGTRKRFSFGTQLLQDILGSISPELSGLTQFELGSRLGYLTRRDQPPDWRS